MEILVVVAILIILIGIYFSVGRSGPGAGVTQTKSTLSVLALRMGDYLKNNAEPTTTNWLALLKTDPNTARDLAKLSQSNGVIIDAFGNPIDYIPSHSPPTSQPAGFFRSPGPDGIAGNGDDIYSGPVAPVP